MTWEDLEGRFLELEGNMRGAYVYVTSRGHRDDEQALMELRGVEDERLRDRFLSLVTIAGERLRDHAADLGLPSSTLSPVRDWWVALERFGRVGGVDSAEMPGYTVKYEIQDVVAGSANLCVRIRARESSPRVSGDPPRVAAPQSPASIEIPAAQRIWLSELLRRAEMGEPCDYRHLRIALQHELPPKFSRADLNVLLVDRDRITLLGIRAVDPKHRLLDATEKAILAIRKHVVAHPDETRVSAGDLAAWLDIEIVLASELFRLMATAGLFWTRADGPESAGYSAIDVGDECLPNYTSFKSLAQWLDELAGRALGGRETFGPFSSAGEGNALVDEPDAGTTLRTTFESYRVTKILGEGGCGTVYEVVSEDGRNFAAKVLDAAKATGNRRRRFKNELQYCRSHAHPNIIAVLDHGLADTGEPFYVMRRYPCNLRERMRQGVSAADALAMVTCVLRGLEAAHVKGVVHRDLKPENILCDGSEVVVADFGIAHFEEADLATIVVTDPRERLANFGYRAPEQRVGGGTVGPPADVYAAGLLINEMFTGSVPEGTGYKTIGAQHPDLAFLDALVARMISQDPDARPQTAAEALSEMARLHRGAQMEGAVPVPPVTPPAADKEAFDAALAERHGKYISELGYQIISFLMLADQMPDRRLNPWYDAAQSEFAEIAGTLRELGAMQEAEELDLSERIRSLSRLVQTVADHRSRLGPASREEYLAKLAEASEAAVAAKTEAFGSHLLSESSTQEVSSHIKNAIRQLRALAQDAQETLVELDWKRGSSICAAAARHGELLLRLSFYDLSTLGIDASRLKVTAADLHKLEMWEARPRGREGLVTALQRVIDLAAELNEICMREQVAGSGVGRAESHT